MHRRFRLASALAVAFALLAWAPASASQGGSVDDFRLASGATLSAGAAVSAATSPAPCADRRYNLTGGRWRTALNWSFRASSTPTGLSTSAVLAVIQRSFSNIVDARNSCGRGDAVSARETYLGTTRSKPGCSTMDGRNVVGFRSLPSGVLGRTCWWTRDGRIVEADIQLNASVPWATSLAKCTAQVMLEAVVTHEVGHAFGLGHVGEAKHGRLTMSTRLDGPCNNQEATLGLGDVLGLEAIY